MFELVRRVLGVQKGIVDGHNLGCTIGTEKKREVVERSFHVAKLNSILDLSRSAHTHTTRTIGVVQGRTAYETANTAESVDSNLGGHGYSW